MSQNENNNNGYKPRPRKRLPQYSAFSDSNPEGTESEIFSSKTKFPKLDEPLTPPKKAEPINKKAKAQKKPRKTPLTADEKKALRKKRYIAAENWKSIKHYVWKLAGSLLLTTVIIICSISMASFCRRAALDFTGISPKDETIEVYIPVHANTDEIAAILKIRGVIDLPDLFTFYSKQFGFDGGYRAGAFTLSTTMSYSAVISNLQAAGEDTYRTVTFTIPPGYNAFQIADALESNKICPSEDFLEYISVKHGEYEFEKRISEKDERKDKFYALEGCLFPDTYDFYVSDYYVNAALSSTAKKYEGKTDEERIAMGLAKSAEIAADKIFLNFNSKITKEMYKQMYVRGLYLDDFLALASLVQAEASTNIETQQEDMAKVASVFYNRLKASAEGEGFDKIESDATIGYARDINIRNKLYGKKYSTKFEELYEIYVNEGEHFGAIGDSVLDAYNTYVSNGLPPGAICNPGIYALIATINPAKTNYYYFASDSRKILYFAETREQHLSNLELIRERNAEYAALAETGEDE